MICSSDKPEVEWLANRVRWQLQPAEAEHTIRDVADEDDARRRPGRHGRGWGRLQEPGVAKAASRWLKVGMKRWFGEWCRS